jgi:hypothetical protein
MKIPIFIIALDGKVLIEARDYRHQFLKQSEGGNVLLVVHCEGTA